MNTPPIPVPDPDSQSLRFPIAFTRFFLVCSFGGLAWSLPIAMLMLPTRSTKESLASLAFSIAVGLIIGAILTVIIMQLLPVVINKTELRSANAWAIPARVSLAEISSIKYTNVLSLPYLKVSTHQKKNVLWLPLFLSDMEGFRAAVTEYTLPGNPLRIALENQK